MSRLIEYLLKSLNLSLSLPLSFDCLCLCLMITQFVAEYIFPRRFSSPISSPSCSAWSTWQWWAPSTPPSPSPSSEQSLSAPLSHTSRWLSSSSLSSSSPLSSHSSFSLLYLGSLHPPQCGYQYHLSHCQNARQPHIRNYLGIFLMAFEDTSPSFIIPIADMMRQFCLCKQNVKCFLFCEWYFLLDSTESRNMESGNNNSP